MSAEPYEGEGAFEPVRFGLGWTAVSVGFFLSTLAMPSILRILPLRPPAGWMWPAWLVLGTGVAALAGMATGGIAWWRDGTTSGRWAFFLNAVVLGLVLLTVLAFVWIRYRR